MFILTLALGITVVAAIAASPLYARRIPTFGSARLSAAAISLALALPLFCTAASGTAGLRSALFLCSFVLILVAAVLVLRDGEEPDEPGERGDDEPPWWPEFEQGFRTYARRRRPPVTTR